ncbi:uncharacterized protein LOC62_04G005349 [Vanrija pseudolonga]|uniref:SH3 domain-containing protein n=1 Tax=Vanrija pseudolonga TaxID=143232 RepID=A0AAF0YBS1_9TREE|nr:hypothetical protein LOC62_04G005349 [Vanrija pseudolonga]
MRLDLIALAFATAALATTPVDMAPRGTHTGDFGGYARITTTAKRVNCRAGPHLTSRVVLQLQPGASVRVLPKCLVDGDAVGSSTKWLEYFDYLTTDDDKAHCFFSADITMKLPITVLAFIALVAAAPTPDAATDATANTDAATVESRALSTAWVWHEYASCRGAPGTGYAEVHRYYRKDRFRVSCYTRNEKVGLTNVWLASEDRRCWVSAADVVRTSGKTWGSYCLWT